MMMNAIDLFIAALLIFGLVKGFMKGLFVELASLVALIAGIYGAFYFSFILEDYLKDIPDINPDIVHFAALAGTFIAIIFGIHLIAKIMTKLAKMVALGFINKLLGGLFGLLKMTFICSVLLILFSKTKNFLPFTNDIDTEESILYEPVKEIVPLILPNVWDFENLFDKENNSKNDNEIV